LSEDGLDPPHPHGARLQRHVIVLALLVLALLGVGMVLLNLRQQRLHILNQTADLYRQIRSSERTLWQQQTTIAAYTSPQAIQNAVTEKPAAPTSPGSSSSPSSADPSARE
jgi:hypothetical protein